MVVYTKKEIAVHSKLRLRKKTLVWLVFSNPAKQDGQQFGLAPVAVSASGQARFVSCTPAAWKQIPPPGEEESAYPDATDCARTCASQADEMEMQDLY